MNIESLLCNYIILDIFKDVKGFEKKFFDVLFLCLAVGSLLERIRE